MAALYGRLQGNRGEATRVGHSSIKAKLETWDGSIEVELEKDGTFTVRIGDKSYPKMEVATGNVNNRTWDSKPKPGPYQPGSTGTTDETGRMIWT